VSAASPRFLQAPGLMAQGVAHGFGLRGAEAPAGTRRAVQVHGARVVRADAAPAGTDTGAGLGEADALVSAAGGPPVAVVTADCVPVLLAAAPPLAAPPGSAHGPETAAVAAVHAGWRGLAAGVVEAAARALAEAAPGVPLHAAVGPRIGPCCYEVDAPVWDALRERYGAAVDAALATTRPGHARLDLGVRTLRALERAGLAPGAVEVLEGVCTRCDPVRFESARRDGPRAGRLVHWIAPVPPPGLPAGPT